MKSLLLSIAILSAAATVAQAEFQRVTDRDTFVQLVQGKTLARPLVRLQVLPDGAIAGRGASWDVTGQWRWQNGFFCRDLNWGGDDLGYNCQEVRANGDRIRFTADEGRGDFADFRLR
ncbi:dihydrodipicolinate reductase [Thalassococcus sp. CAU 1522]|uniref:Dihydrodipicolinate reductase n=1 Tax=Thalassococcus arenae TaxID=2851652 RepID=A0ABS6N7Y9_9RHOB|nr:dihydrodipicolinate reductase [Thalassococcus arenae]MBV2360131.1 dihydrodipicolinate reductase [Thalassococcus arenae]